jgi:DNA-binding SARP family transcriptional activator
MTVGIDHERRPPSQPDASTHPSERALPVAATVPDTSAREPRPQFVRSKVHAPRMRSMGRERLDGLLDDGGPRLALVVAPAGSGKTTLLARWAAAARDRGAVAAWYRAESTDATTAALLGYVQLAIDEALAGAGPGIGARPTGNEWRSVEQVAAWLERSPRRPILLFVDDLHLLDGSDAECALDRLVDLAGPALRTVVGTRSAPAFNIPRLRLSGDLLEVTGDDLRFRSWEVERLFRDYYGESLRGDELGRLARRTAGWVAGLQLFHLATRDKAPAERTRLLHELGGSGRLIHEYLTRNVLDELPDDLRRFLVETSPLRRLSGPLCDRYLGRTGSAALLSQLERHQVFTVQLDDGTYRYHEVLQSFLERVLVESIGEPATRAASARAAALLEEQGALADALAAYGRADRWEDVSRVLGDGGAKLTSERSAGRLAEAAPAVVRNDPWLRLASARRLRADGHWAAAIEAFSLAEAAFGTAEAAALCRTERLALASFFDPSEGPAGHWVTALRAAVRRDPLGRGAVRRSASDTDGNPGDRLARGLAELLAGFVGRARETLLDVAQDPDVDPAMAAAATVAAAAAGLLAGEPRAVAEIDQGAAMAETSGLGWLARVARYARLLRRQNPTPEQLGEIRDARRVAGSNGDVWGETLAELAEGIVLMGEPGEAIRSLERGAAGARRLGAGSIEAWAASLEALASARLEISDARELALRAESLTRSAGVAGARVVVYAALALCDPDHAEQHLALAAATARETGLRLDWAAEPPAADSAAADRSATGRSTAEPLATGASVTDPPTSHSAPDEGAAAVEICLLGGFEMAIGGRHLDLGSVKPRPRAILRFLALNAGQPVHREVLEATFWPDADPATAARNVHVALSGLRRLLCPSGDADCQVLVREGEAYRLALPGGSRVDLFEVERALAEAEAAQGIGDGDAARSLRREAIRHGTRELLPEDGPADWVVYRREQLRVELAAAARSVAESVLEADPGSAAEVCAAGLRVDATDDGLWRLLIAARERSGDPAAAEGARQGYRRLLEQLGVASRLDPEDVTADRGTRPR